MNRTYSPRASEIEHSWFVVDASGQRLGTLASRIAFVLEGKHKPTFATHIDTGDHVIVLNASRIDVTGKKSLQKKYSRHSGYPGGYREETLGHLLERRPEEVIRRAVKGMLPRNKLGVQQLRKLKVYAGTVHPHEAQMPEVLPGTTLTFDPAEMKPKPKPQPAPKAEKVVEPEVEETPVVAAAETELPAEAEAPVEAEAVAEPETETIAAEAEAATEEQTTETDAGDEAPEAEASDDATEESDK